VGVKSAEQADFRFNGAVVVQLDKAKKTSSSDWNG
jgi:hypothetical protein